jgi:NADH-quinone oxidoreductase subunit E
MTRVLSDEVVQQIKSLMQRYPSQQAVTLPALHAVHQQLRYVPLEAVVEIAELLELAPSQIQDTLSFYGFFHQDRPHGETRAWVCRSISCALRGGDQILEHLCRRTGVHPGGTTDDGLLTLESAECLGACEFAPCMLAGNELVKNLDTSTADGFLRKVGCTTRTNQVPLKGSM